MSTSVNYKGNEIASFSNTTKTLKTSGKYLEGDISITDTSGAGAVVVTEEQDTGGGIVKNITAVDISNDTVDAAHLLSGYTAHDGQGNAVTGSYVPPSPTLITKSITANGTYSAEDDSADGYSEVTVNVSGGGGGSSEDGDVIFIDYDGTVLHSYTAAEALALTELPANPLVSSYSERITPYRYDYEPGWVESSNGMWHYENSTNNHTDVYQVEKGKSYKLQLGSTVGNVFAATLIGINPVGDTSNVQGTFIIGKPSPSANDSILFIADKNGYLMVTKDYNNTTGLQSYLYERVVNDPKYAPLTAQGWNYTLAQIKTEVNSVGQCVVGQMYGTFDGNTRIYIHIPKNTPEAQMTFYVRYTQSKSKGVTVYWGDGSITSDTSTSASNRSHTYTNPGDYEITLATTNGTLSFVGSSSYTIYGATSNSWNSNRIKKIHFGNGVISIGDRGSSFCYGLEIVTFPNVALSIADGGFRECTKLKSITFPRNVTSIGTWYNNYSVESVSIPNNVTSIPNSFFSNGTSLKLVAIPSSVTSIGTSCFSNCCKLKEIIIPEGVTTISAGAFQQCYALQKIIILGAVETFGNNALSGRVLKNNFVIPDSTTTIGQSSFGSLFNNAESIIIPKKVTSIGSSAFSSMSSLEEYHFLPETPPVLAAQNSLDRSKYAKIYVPYSADHSVLADYKAASIFSNWADYIFEEEPA